MGGEWKVLIFEVSQGTGIVEDELRDVICIRVK